MSYPAGSVKYDAATGDVAVRTGYVQDVENFWLVLTQTAGGRYATDTDVASWTDVTLPAAEEGGS